MKKPSIEIIRGYPPSLKKMNHVFVNGNRLCICEKDSQSDAVRSMIDALILAYSVFHDDHKFDSSGKGLACGEIEQALKKAGYEL